MIKNKLRVENWSGGEMKRHRDGELECCSKRDANPEARGGGGPGLLYLLVSGFPSPPCGQGFKPFTNYLLEIITFRVDVDFPEVNFSKYKPGGRSVTFIDAAADLELDNISKNFTLCPFWLNNSIRQLSACHSGFISMLILSSTGFG